MITVVSNPLLPGEIICTRKYGRTTHVMQLTDEGHAPKTGAICGTVPTGSPRRAGWWRNLDTAEVTCPKCKAILDGRNEHQLDVVPPVHSFPQSKG